MFFWKKIPMNEKTLQALFGCCRIHFNPHVLGWIEVEFSLSSTPIQLNTYGLIRIRRHPNKAIIITQSVGMRILLFFFVSPTIQRGPSIGFGYAYTDMSCDF
jgi:hypothetical protein